MHTTQHTFTAALLGVALLATGGCAADGLAVAARGDPPQPVDLRSAFGQEPVAGVYRVDAGPLAGEQVAFSITPLPADAEAGASDQDNGGTAPGQMLMEVQSLRETSLERDDQGSVAIPQTIDLLEQVRVVYEPAATIVPARMHVGEVRRQEFQMNVYHLADGSRRAGGSGSIELELVEVGAFDTPIGRVDGYRLRERHDLHLSLARVNVEVDTIYGHEIGPVRKSTVRRTRALGLFGSTERETLVRIE